MKPRPTARPIDRRIRFRVVIPVIVLALAAVAADCPFEQSECALCTHCHPTGQFYDCQVAGGGCAPTGWDCRYSFQQGSICVSRGTYNYTYTESATTYCVGVAMKGTCVDGLNCPCVEASPDGYTYCVVVFLDTFNCENLGS